MDLENSVLGSVIEAGNVPLPPFTGKLIQNAPESFSNPDAGQIAVTVRAMRHAGEPVNSATVSEKHLPLVSFILAEVCSGALPLDAAEFYAEKCWREYQGRKVQGVLAEAHEQAIAHPDQAAAIAAAVRSALDAVTSDSANGLTIRTPDEILNMDFDDSDIILGDRIIAEGQSCVIAAAGGSGKSRLRVSRSQRKALT